MVEIDKQTAEKIDRLLGVVAYILRRVEFDSLRWQLLDEIDQLRTLIQALAWGKES